MKEWQKRDEKSIWHPFSPLKGKYPNLPVVRASGVHLITEDNRRIIDAISSWWVNLHGHSNPFIAEAIGTQAATLEHVIFAGFTHAPAVELAEFLLDIFPGDFASVFYSDNGSTSVEVAVKMGLQYWYNRGEQRKKIVALDGAYHGDTFGAMAVGERSIFTKPFFPFLFDVEFLPFPTGSNDDQVVDTFRRLLDDEDVAVFIFEPLVQGAAGMRMYSAEILNTLMRLAADAGVITIADEVMTGFGRTGTIFACEQLSMLPDLVCLSKGLTGGALPLGATLCSKHVQDPFKSEALQDAFLHGHSYTANPIACAAALASGKLLRTADCIKNIDRITDQHRAFAAKLKHHEKIVDIRTLGTILAIEFKSATGQDYLSEMRNELYPFFLERDILLRPLGNLIYVLPPYIISNEDLGKIYTAIEEYLRLRPE